MTASHLRRLRTKIEKLRWTVADESTFTEAEQSAWAIARPNGDCPLVLEFTPGGLGIYGGGEIIDSFEHAFAVCVQNEEAYPSLYFGRFQGQFQIDVTRFVVLLAGVKIV